MTVLWPVPTIYQKACSVIFISRASFRSRTLGSPPCWKNHQEHALGVCYIHSEKQGRGKASVQFLKWGAVGLFISAAVSVSAVWWEMGSLKNNLSNVSSAFSPVTFWQKPFHLPGKTTGENDSWWFPWLQSKSHDLWTLLNLCESESKAASSLGIRALASKTWEEYQYRYVAQAADNRTLIGLARTEGSHPHFFLPMPTLAKTETTLTDELAKLVLTVDNGKGRSLRTSNALTLADNHLHRKLTTTDDKMRFWGFGGLHIDVATVDSVFPEDVLLLNFLQAISEITAAPDRAIEFVHQHGLAALQRVISQEWEEAEILQNVANILGNLALEPRLHDTIVRTGWLGVLKSWMEGEDTALAVLAGRALANLDREWTGYFLEDGVFILHPLYRSEKTVLADIIFVHGLRGGGVKTWRQQDSAAEQRYPRSVCWPKDWLARDCPHVRILSLHYNTALSSLSGNAVTDKEKSTLEGRSREMLSKLLQASVGKRPIIWAGHSMGGLLIKKMVSIALHDEHFKDMQDNTCGFLMFSVPHHGVSLAALSNQAQYLLYPSIEVKELSTDSPHLTQLHRQFQALVRTRNIPCLCFGETVKTKLSKRLPKVLLVPPESSDPGVGEFCQLPIDHINICKPSNCDCELYAKTLAFVHRCIFMSYINRMLQQVTSG